MNRLPFLLATIYSLLVSAEFFFLPPGVGRLWTFITCSIGSGMLWLMAILIRQRRQDEKDLRKLNSELEQRVMRRTQELQREVSERKRAEEQVHEQARLLDLAHDAIIVRDFEDRILYWNKGAERVYGWTALEAVGQKTIQLLHKDFFEHEEALKTVLEKGDWTGELTVRKKTGQEMLVEVRWRLIRDDQGTQKSILAINTDITEKRKLEMQTLRSQRMESVGTLVGGIAHDFNNMLTPLLVSVQLLKEKLTDAERQKLLDTLETSVQRGAKLVKLVLTFGRGVKGDRILVRPASVVQEIEQIVNETFPKLVELQINSIAGLWTVTGDATQLHQVLLNLCVNARDAMPAGGKLSIHMKNVVLDEIHAGKNPEAKPGPYVAITVADNGTGIPKEIQDKIFEPFFTTKAPGRGTGLGLATCLGIIKSHGGFINFDSEAGKGSVFKVFLPANVTSVEMKGLVLEQSKMPCGHDELVLVVDDEEAIREVAQKILERFGYRVLTAVNGAEAVSIYQERQHEIAVVITDMAMPVMDGPAAINALQAINPRIRIIGASGLDTENGMAKAQAAGVKHFIPKPHTTEVLLHTLHQVLHQPAAGNFPVN